MATIIQVCGLPRSGTAWVSTLLNINNDCCASHELAAYDPNWRTTLSKWTKSLFVADCSTTGFLPGGRILRSRPIALVRDRVEAFESAMNLTHEWDFKGWSLLVEAFDNWLKEVEAPQFEFDELFTEESATAIWELCFARRPSELEAAKIRGLIKMNVQVQDAKDIMRLTPERATTLRNLLTPCHSD